MKRHSLLYIQSFLAHGIGLLLVIILLVVAQDFVSERPALASLLVLAFSLSYLAAAVRNTQAYYLYGGMLLGAASYFMACHSLGAPVNLFPPLSVPLVFILWIVGWNIRQRLPRGYDSFAATTFRAMNITVSAFAAQALWQMPNLLSPGGAMGAVAGITLFGYTLLYLLHAATFHYRLYACIFSAFLVAAVSLTGMTFFQPATLPYFLHGAAFIMLIAGVYAHRAAGFKLSRFYYACFGVALGLATLGIWIQPSQGLHICAVGTALTTLAYLLLTVVVPDVVRATSDERLTAKFFISASFLFSLPIVPFLFLPGLSVYWASAALIAGAAFSVHAWYRRADKHSARNIYIHVATLFLAAAIAGKGESSFNVVAVALLVVAAHLFFLHRSAMRRIFSASAPALAESLAAPAFFAWYMPLMAGEHRLALAGALASLAVAGLAGLAARQAAFLSGAGPALAGAWIVLAMPAANTVAIPPWVVMVVGAAVIGLGLGISSLMRAPQAIRILLGLGWLVLSAVGPAVVYVGGNASETLLASTGMTAVALMVAGLLHSQPSADRIFHMSAWLVGLIGIGMLCIFGVTAGLGMVTIALGLAILAAVAILMSIARGSVWLGRLGFVLFAVSGITLAYLYARRLDYFLLYAAAIPVALFLTTTLPRVFNMHFLASSALATAHGAAVVLGAMLLILAYSSPVTPDLALALIPYVCLYGAGAFIWRTGAFRFGAALASSILVVFAFAAYSGTFYTDHAFSAVLLGALWAALATLLARYSLSTWADSLYLAASWIVAGAALLPLVAPPSGEAWHVFLVAGLTYVALSLLLRQDIYAYLVTLCLAMMAYDWVRLTTSHFTQDVFFYPLLAAIVLTTILLLPHIKRMVNRIASLPVFNIFSAVGAVLALTPLMGGGAFFVSAYSLKVTAHPRFCTSCHYMEEYYQSWSHSSHADVACVKCHYEPGLKSEIIGKGDGLIQLIKYLSHTYGNRPHGIISNSSCMQSGCHEDIADVGKMLLYDGKIRFRHDSHLTEHPRGQDLNCVSCHGQMVQGSHIAVTQTTCITCHFYGRGENAVAIGDCLSCHAVLDETVTIGNEVFDHPAFLADKATVECTHCHSQVTQGHGEISEARCNTCHLGPHEPIEDLEEFHLIHAQIKQFDCLQCHDKIRHGVHPRDQQMLFSAEDCAACHTGERHTIQKRIYAGNALPDLDPAPDFMYVAGVTCDGCHTTTQMIRVGEMTLTGKVSTAAQCSDCHADENYGEMLLDWQDEIRSWVERIETELDALADEIERVQSAESEIEGVNEYQRAAQSKVDIIVRDGSYGGHNYFYITGILSEADQDLRAARQAFAAWIAETEEADNVDDNEEFGQ